MKKIRLWPSGRAGTARATAAGSRLGWLDALRGLAALVVALHHFGILEMLPFGGAVWSHFDLGLYGVMVFFLVSGYIIPASLERRGDVRAFWVGRLFRIYPALIATFVVAIMILPEGDGSVALFRTGHNLISLVANATMLQDMLNVVNGMGVTWTLTYEMVFYFLVTGLFSVGWHRRSSVIAVGFATIGLVFGGVLAADTFGHDLDSTRHLVLAAALVVVMGFVCMLSGNPALTKLGGLLVGCLAAVLLFTNSRAPGFETMLIFATMFAGTVLYRAEHGQIDRTQAWICCGFVIVAGVAMGWMYNRNGMENYTWNSGWIAWCASYTGAWATFLGAMALRKKRFPKVLTWLGAVSFSVYLLHVHLLHTIGPLVGVPPRPTETGAKVLWTVEFLAVTLVAAYLMYRLVELPFQKLGKKALKALERIAPAPAPAPAPAVEQAGPAEPRVPVEAGSRSG
ncbi:peptidoglycan/LPS O-acetylase OafA/YrhL [Kitasatospora sp. MAA19]|uniref:acyltransferase family protein n=1 Tax=unclassified Kitasatospora TaxID=2633591 RepID=UPI002476CF70|nr:acyltransferase [Kitasatospora sp. MAA19]MDH6703641.1 peptidoglycan/LPS O-acetylase OafA/YrhL [Kitasatospora sp. MAA19]